MTENNHYPHQTLDAKWQKHWLENKTFETQEDLNKPKYFTLDMFPYPSGAGLHVGHPESYTATDIIARYKRMKGFEVLRPMGWDAFGLPAEQYALQTGTHPRITTQKNIANFKKQINRIGFCYDWNREIDTTDPEYYQWTQWIFLQMFKKGLAYQDEIQVNWCPELGTVLANEEVIDGKSERGGHPVYRQALRQWMLKITAYAEKLESDLDSLDWPEPIKQMQRNWIGKSSGAEVSFGIQNHTESLLIYTTRPDTLFGVSYMVLAPEHPLVHKLVSQEQKKAVEAYIAASQKKSDLQRTHLDKEKTGVFTGSYALNPVNNEKVPIWISDYVLMSYGTGAIMAVPAHDERDFQFAKQYGLPIKQVVSSDGKVSELEAPFCEEGIAVQSGSFDGLKSSEFKEKISAWLEEKNLGKKSVKYKLRDWVFSRQRYWGEPIPIYFPVDIEPGLDPKTHPHQIRYDKPIPVSEAELPLKLPELKQFEPGTDPAGPLARVLDWRYFQKDGSWYARETNTMPQWAGSSWYYLRYIDPKNKEKFADPQKLKYWLPVDIYIGGAEHAVLHLLYARFWHKFLYDEGHLPCPEPFMKLKNQGLILAEDGSKMSKSKGNVVNPDLVIDEYGADALRLYEMFMGPLEMAKPWSTTGIMGVRRFIDKVWRLIQKPITNTPLPESSEKILHKTIQKVERDIETQNFNTAISSMMELVNDWTALPELNKKSLEDFIKILCPFAPHLAEEAWEGLGHKISIANENWPSFDSAKTQESEITLVIQINGKIKDKIPFAKGLDKSALEKAALASPKIQSLLLGKTLKKMIVVPDKLVNMVLE